MPFKNKQRKMVCMYCGDTYLRGNIHRCQAGYDKVMQSQTKIREKSTNIWEPTLTPPPVPLTKQPGWPMSSVGVDYPVAEYINELHELILDLSLRIQDLEEERD